MTMRMDTNSLGLPYYCGHNSQLEFCENYNQKIILYILLASFQPGFSKINLIVISDL